MADEIELKLALPETAQPLLLRHPLLKAATARRRDQLLNIYYDTPGRDLRRRGIALRLRRQGRLWLQTVKCAGTGGGGLTARPEWETPYGGAFDFSAVDDDDVRGWLERGKVRNRLLPLFETSFRRATWSFEAAGGGRVLLMLDRGWIAAAGRREAISEVEIESAGAAVADLFDLARRLARRVPLAPAVLSKAERGYRLYQGMAPTPEKAAAVPLTPAASPLTAFRAIAAACLEQIAANHPGATASSDPEFIHQLRVATRRLRACLRIFAPLLPPELLAEILPALRDLMGPLGHARDLDVLLAEIVAPVTGALPGEPRLAALAGVVTDRRYAARGVAVQTLQATHYGQLLLRIAASLHGTAFADDEAPGALLDFAGGRLRRLGRRVRRLAEAARMEEPASLHALRIRVKRLRYALEFFSSLLDSAAGRRRALRLAAVQDTLGQLNDLANAGRLLMECAGSDLRLREAVTLVGGWHGPRHSQLMAQVPAMLDELRRLKVPPLASSAGNLTERK
ncbi:MAG TPA: CYTH and CHAD domain-containing protein [Rhodocyclaceae bacterium]|nr:CYTH and CHAD domain-containing protein [Rhodocyclaceae bacterium]